MALEQLTPEAKRALDATKYYLGRGELGFGINSTAEFEPKPDSRYASKKLTDADRQEITKFLDWGFKYAKPLDVNLRGLYWHLRDAEKMQKEAKTDLEKAVAGFDIENTEKAIKQLSITGPKFAEPFVNTQREGLSTPENLKMVKATNKKREDEAKASPKKEEGQFR